MPLPPTLGSQALPFQLQRAGLQLRSDVQRNSLEMTTGRAADPARHLRGDLAALGSIEARLSRVGAQISGLNSAGLAAEAAQTGLKRLAERGGAIWTSLLTVTSGEPGADALTRTGQIARGGLEDMLSTLGMRVSGRAIFAGAHSDRAPLPDAATVMAEISALVAGAASADEIVLLVDQAFDTPGGIFETLFYSGGDPVPFAPAGPGTELAPLPTAADPAIRGMLRHAVLGALLADTATVPDLGMRRSLAALATERYPTEAERLVSLQARVGEIEGAVVAAQTRLSHEEDALVRARGDLIGVDPYLAASRLEEARARLEALYVVTARVARLNLTEYLR